MRLVNTESLELKLFENERQIPPYAILSHRWEKDEVLFSDIGSEDLSCKKGYSKFAAACTQARKNDFSFIWIDTCCIDKSSSSELSEAINSMYRWYTRAAVCYVYLSDVQVVGDVEVRAGSIVKSLWFNRCWTLQELVAPKTLIFFDRDFSKLGTKNQFQHWLSRKTGIPQDVLCGNKPPTKCTISQVMQWAAGRIATREEDIAYSLLGLFDVNMPMLYGEGSKAFLRLQEEILKKTHDHSIFMCQVSPGEIFANSPDAFIESSLDKLGVKPEWSDSQPYSMTNLGLSITFDLVQWDMNIYLARLEGLKYDDFQSPCIFLRQIVDNFCERVTYQHQHVRKDYFVHSEKRRKPVFVVSNRFIAPDLGLPKFYGLHVKFTNGNSQPHVEFDDMGGLWSKTSNILRFGPEKGAKVFSVKWLDGRYTTVKVRFDFAFAPVCLIKNSHENLFDMSSKLFAGESVGDDVSVKTFEEADGLETYGWSNYDSDQNLCSTQTDFWAVKKPCNAAPLFHLKEYRFSGIRISMYQDQIRLDGRETNLWHVLLAKDPNEK